MAYKYSFISLMDFQIKIELNTFMLELLIFRLLILQFQVNFLSFLAKNFNKLELN